MSSSNIFIKPVTATAEQCLEAFEKLSVAQIVDKCCLGKRLRILEKLLENSVEWLAKNIRNRVNKRGHHSSIALSPLAGALFRTEYACKSHDSSDPRKDTLVRRDPALVINEHRLYEWIQRPITQEWLWNANPKAPMTLIQFAGCAEMDLGRFLPRCAAAQQLAEHPLFKRVFPAVNIVLVYKEHRCCVQIQNAPKTLSSEERCSDLNRTVDPQWLQPLNDTNVLDTSNNRSNDQNDDDDECSEDGDECSEDDDDELYKRKNKSKRSIGDDDELVEGDTDFVASRSLKKAVRNVAVVKPLERQKRASSAMSESSETDGNAEIMPKKIKNELNLAPVRVKSSSSQSSLSSSATGWIPEHYDYATLGTVMTKLLSQLQTQSPWPIKQQHIHAKMKAFDARLDFQFASRTRFRNDEYCKLILLLENTPYEVRERMHRPGDDKPYYCVASRTDPLQTSSGPTYSRSVLSPAYRRHYYPNAATATAQQTLVNYGATLKQLMSEFQSTANPAEAIEWFMHPVLSVLFEDYDAVVGKANRMDLSTVQTRLLLGNYDHDPSKFITDINQIWINCEKYNGNRAASPEPVLLASRSFARLFQSLINKYQLHAFVHSKTTTNANTTTTTESVINDNDSIIPELEQFKPVLLTVPSQTVQSVADDSDDSDDDPYPSIISAEWCPAMLNEFERLCQQMLSAANPPYIPPPILT